jgi:hypothetical protein
MGMTENKNVWLAEAFPTQREQNSRFATHNGLKRQDTTQLRATRKRNLDRASFFKSFQIRNIHVQDKRARYQF